MTRWDITSSLFSTCWGTPNFALASVTSLVAGVISSAKLLRVNRNKNDRKRGRPAQD